MAGFNAMNRWTGPLRLTQQDFRLYLTPTAPKYATGITRVGPVPEGIRGAVPGGDQSAAAAGIAVGGRVEVGRVQGSQAAIRAGGRIGRAGDGSRGHIPVG